MYVCVYVCICIYTHTFMNMSIIIYHALHVQHGYINEKAHVE